MITGCQHEEGVEDINKPFIIATWEVYIKFQQY